MNIKRSWMSDLWAKVNGSNPGAKLRRNPGNARIGVKDKDGRTPLSWAAGSGHVKVVEMFLSTDQTQIGDQDKYGRTALSWAVGAGHVDVAKLLQPSRS